VNILVDQAPHRQRPDAVVESADPVEGAFAEVPTVLEQELLPGPLFQAVEDPELGLLEVA
jgi:hypothetical protein